MTAYAQLSDQMAEDMSRAIFTEDKRRLAALTEDQRLHKDDLNKKYEQLSVEIARKDQQIAALEESNAQWSAKNKTLGRAVEMLQRELDKTTQSLNDTQQNAVELRMQGWDFKSEVDLRGNKVLSSVQTRMGFVPSGIQKQIALLKSLKVSITNTQSCCLCCYM